MTKTDEMMNVVLLAVVLLAFTGVLVFKTYVDFYKEVEKNIPYASKSQVNEIAMLKTSLIGYPFGYIEELTIKTNHLIINVCKDDKTKGA